MWQQFLTDFAQTNGNNYKCTFMPITLLCVSEGKTALKISKPEFNKVASREYPRLTSEEKDEMKQKMDGTNQMEIRQWSARRRIRTISERLQKLVGIHVIVCLWYNYGFIYM